MAMLFVILNFSRSVELEAYCIYFLNRQFSTTAAIQDAWGRVLVSYRYSNLEKLLVLSEIAGKDSNIPH